MTHMSEQQHAIQQRLIAHPLCAACLVEDRVIPAITAINDVDGEMRSMCRDHAKT